VAGNNYTGPLIVVNVPKLHTLSQEFALSWAKEGLRCSFVPTPFDLLLGEVLPWGLRSPRTARSPQRLAPAAMLLAAERMDEMLG
jgi:hypothetical protein